ncbi:hypothetical protein GDO81_019003, partial [Engystomops pustulosus]
GSCVLGGPLPVIRGPYVLGGPLPVIWGSCVLGGPLLVIRGPCVLGGPLLVIRGSCVLGGPLPVIRGSWGPLPVIRGSCAPGQLTCVSPQVRTMSSLKSSGSAERQEFCSFFDQVVQDLTAQDWGHPEIGDAVSRVREVLEYNAPGGKCNRGMTVLASYRELVGPELHKEGNIQRALAVGWCVELVSA